MSLRMTPKQARNFFKQKGTTKAPSDKPRYQPSEDAIQTAVINWAKLVKYKDKTLSDYLHHSPIGN